MKAKTVKEVLIAARWILDNYGWCQKAYARDAKGKSVYESSPGAASFCAIGSVRVVETTSSSLANQAIDLLANVSKTNQVCLPGDSPVAVFNDQPTRTKEEVLALFDQAIKEAT